MPLIEAQPDALAKVYASSLFELAQADGGRDRTEDVLGELEAVLEAARADATFNEFLASRVLPAKSREQSLRTIFEGKMSPLTLNFLRLLNDKGRLSHLPAITAALDSMVQEAFGRVEVDVYTAESLDDAGKTAIRDRVASKLGKEVVLHAYVEPAMLGGIKLRIGDQLVDDSLATQLRRVRDKLVTDGGSRIRATAGDLIERDESN